MKIEVQARDGPQRFEAGRGEKLLFAGLSRSVGLPYECASGTCGTCSARVLEGEVHDAWPEAPGRKALKAGEILMCQCTAQSDLRLEIRGATRPPRADAGAPAAYAGCITASRRLAGDVLEFDVELDRPMRFAPGQFALVRVPGIEGHRGWSMVNHDGAARALRFVVKRKPGGRVSEWLFAHPPEELPLEGTPVEVFGPLGRATFDPAEGHGLLCIAGGSGIAGMMAILECAARARYFEAHAGDVFFGVRTMRDAFYLGELGALRARCGEGLRVVVALSEQAAADEERAAHPLLEFDHGFVHEVAARRMQGRTQGVCAFLAGPPPAVDAGLRMLLMARVPAANIRYDKFS